jgi:hypothetical protein
VYLTGRTPVGPLTVGVGATTTDSWSLWVAVGRPVGRGTILEKGIFDNTVLRASVGLRCVHVMPGLARLTRAALAGVYSCG